jgi:hypothetical protein
VYMTDAVLLETIVWIDLPPSHRLENLHPPQLCVAHHIARSTGTTPSQFGPKSARPTSFESAFLFSPQHSFSLLLNERRYPAR